jgi:hypothetical protein
MLHVTRKNTLSVKLFILKQNIIYIYIFYLILWHLSSSIIFYMIMDYMISDVQKNNKFIILLLLEAIKLYRLTCD